MTLHWKPSPILASFTLAVALLGSTAALAQTYAQSPLFDAMADLPPVEDRLPDAPLVLEPVDSVGQYGGTLRQVTEDTLGWLRQLVLVEPWAKWERDLNGTRPNILEGWTWNDAYTEVTLNFREGMRWSDGDPVTADDFMFFWNDMVLNENIPVTFPGGTVVNGEPMTVEKIDDFTIKLTFSGPNPLFIELSSRGHYNSSIWMVPEHYMRQFHPDYSDATDTTALMSHYESTTRLQQLGMPTLSAWMVTEYQPGERIVAQRNPYYWKVDTEGHQLPYIDTIDTIIATSAAVGQTTLLNAIGGNLDFQARDYALADYSILLENQEAGNYTVKMWNRGDFAWPWIMVAYDHVDQGIVDLFYMPEFRRALSHAMDRNKINDIVSFGLATPRQFALSPESPEFQTPEGQAIYQEWSTSYTEFDPALAGSLLDGIGVVDADGDGWRDRPDGSRLQLIIDVPASSAESVSAVDLIKQDWEAIGIELILNAIDWSAIDARANNGEMMLRAWPSASGWGLLSAATVWAPIEGFTWSIGGVSIGRYFQTGGVEGQPARPGSMLERLQQAYAKAISTVDPAERDAALLEAYRIHIDEGPITLGTVGEHPSPVVVSNRLRNVVETGLTGSWDLGFPGTADPEQFYFAD